MGCPRTRGNLKICRANFQGTAMSYYRTPEHRALRAELIRKWKPWEESTGPKSVEGKAKVSRNAYKGGWRGTMREIRRALLEMDRVLDSVQM